MALASRLLRFSPALSPRAANVRTLRHDNNKTNSNKSKNNNNNNHNNITNKTFIFRHVRRCGNRAAISQWLEDTDTSPPPLAQNSLASLVAVRAAQAPESLALSAPQQGVSWSFKELEEKAARVAAALAARGYARGQVLVTDLPNSVENLLLQVACSHLGVAVATAKDPKTLEKLVAARPWDVRGAVCGPSFLIKSQLSLPPVIIEELDGSLSPLLSSGDKSPLAEPRDNAALGYWNVTKALTNGEALGVMGAAAAERLAVTAEDRVLVSISLCHAFGIGSAVGGAWLGGAAAVLPGAIGIQGCDSPSQLAEATLACLVSQRCSLLFVDVYTLKGLPVPSPGLDLSALRGGVCKVGSGADFLEEIREAKIGPDGELRPLEYAGVQILAMGRKS
ncbi:unnamed protein product [Polarella glacialis]|uniref:AMP-dependent synthetase/ligase domain-containing protein n=1 Tax=Polarella glacialis TaxID=89957 RepID=A0A813KGK6_POLGL|nr:unnamed protein product [Polarella glacialis]